MANLKDYLTVTEAAKILGVSSITLRRWDNEGKLKAIKHPINRYRLYKKKELEEFLRKIENGET